MSGRERVIAHYGPDPSFAGGVSSVMRVFAEHQIGGAVELHATWQKSRPAMVRSTVAALQSVRRLPSDAVVHVHLAQKGSLLRKAAVLRAAGARGLPTAATIHGSDFVSFAEANSRLVRAVLGMVDVTFCLTGDTETLVASLGTRTRVERLTNPMPVDIAAPKASETGEVVLFAGEIGVRKGVDVLARAWPTVQRSRPSAVCLVVGPQGDFSVPPSSGLVQRPAVSQSELRDLLRTVRAVVLPSRAEAMPMVLLEAMAAGRPFVATPVGQVAELARDGGLLTAVGDDAELAHHLVHLLEDPEVAGDIGAKGQAACLRDRSISRVDEQLRQAYAAITATHR